MGLKVMTTKGRCRHEKCGRCTNHFWEVMKKLGKSGLIPYQCRLWKSKLEALNQWHDALWRARCFGLSEEKQRETASRAVLRKAGSTPVCPQYRPGDERWGGSQVGCRYFFLETCLLEFPECPGDCDDFLPRGDQGSV